MGADLRVGRGQGSGFVGTATHGPRVRPDVEYMRDQQRSRGRVGGAGPSSGRRPLRASCGGYSTRVGIHWPGVVRTGRTPEPRGVHPPLPQWPPTLVQYGVSRSGLPDELLRAFPGPRAMHSIPP